MVFETGVHFIDTFRYLGGEIDNVYSILRRLNPVIVGEDAGVLVLQFQSGAVGLWDANRYNECSDDDPRYTFGEFLVEGNGGTIRLYLDGRITIQQLGQPETEHAYHHERRNFSGDCVYTTQRHFVDCMLADRQFRDERGRLPEDANRPRSCLQLLKYQATNSDHAGRLVTDCRTYRGSDTLV